jgi:hypothetical protein
MRRSGLVAFSLSAVLGIAAVVGATLPCDAFKYAPVVVRSITVDGAQVTPSVTPGTQFLLEAESNDDDTEATFWGYDPTTGGRRRVALRRVP